MRSTTKVKCCRHLKLDTKMPRKCQDKTSCYYSSQEHITEIKLHMKTARTKAVFATKETAENCIKSTTNNTISTVTS